MIGRLQRNNKGLGLRSSKGEAGFTIIEVLIVLAIAGLIMLIVFLAVPALQRNQRNNARNSEASRISTAVTECLANRNGQTTSCDAVADLPNMGITVIAGPPATLQGYQQFTSITFNNLANNAAPAAVPTALSTANVDFGVKCAVDGATVTTTNATPRDFTVTWRNEPNVARCIGSESN